MASVTIKWTIAADGRQPGDIETDIEVTDLVKELLKQGRIVIVKDEKPAVEKKSVEPKE